MKHADAPASPDDLQLHRLSTAYRLVSVFLTALGSVWIAWMVVAGQWHLVPINVAYVAVGIALWRSVDRPLFRPVAAIAHILLFFVIAQISLLYDVPNEAAPRVTHLYFLSMAFLFYLTFRQISAGPTYAVVLLYLAAFALFAGTNFVLPSATPLPDDMRAVGAWMHSIGALAIMCTCVYIMQSDFAARARLTRQLTTALAERQLELYFQPQVSVDSSVIGAEALIRWNHPKRGVLGPGEFLDAAEQLGLMAPIGRWVLSEACQRLAKWQGDPRTAGLTLSVNVSASQFMDREFVGDIKRIVRQTGIAAETLELELTESVVVVAPDEVIERMNQLVEFGVRLSLDDFGTGYSALQYLKRMPFSKLKIDQSFVRDMLHDERDAVIVKGIVQLGGELHIATVAEGVESDGQKRMLASMGCSQFQGYLFGRPVPVAQFEQALPPFEGLSAA